MKATERKRTGVYRLDEKGFATISFYNDGETYVRNDVLRVVRIDKIEEENGKGKIKTFVYDESEKTLLFVREQGFEYGIYDKEAGIISGTCIDTTYYPYTDIYGYGQMVYKRFMKMGIKEYELRREERIYGQTKIEVEYDGYGLIKERKVSVNNECTERKIYSYDYSYRQPKLIEIKRVDKTGKESNEYVYTRW